MNIFPLLLGLFIFVPLIELYVLISVGDVIGALPTILLVIATAFSGVFLIRFQGLLTLQRVQNSMAKGEMPALAVLEGFMLLLAGIFLLTPGFITDSLGFLCLIPWFRRALIAAFLFRKIGPQAEKMQEQGVDSLLGNPHPSASSSRTKKTNLIIEGEVIRDDKPEQK